MVETEMKKELVVIIILVAALLGILFSSLIFERKQSFGGLGDLDLQAANATGTVVTVNLIATEVLATKSGRSWFRLTNLSASSTISCVLSSSTAGMIINAGIILEPAVTTATRTYFDSNESRINYEGAVNCIANVTTSIATYER